MTNRASKASCNRCRWIRILRISNIAVAIASVRKLDHINRIAVVAWDVHHGNGAQDISYDDPDVLTISLHEDRLFPTDGGMATETGGPNALGTCINVPLPAGSGNDVYMHAFNRVVEPAIDAFEPDIIFVASGYDSSTYDPNGRMALHSDSYRELTARIMGLTEVHCQSRVVVVYEGILGIYVQFFLGGHRAVERPPNRRC